MAVFQFSDVLGDHKIYLSTALTINFKRSDYSLAYRYLPKLNDWTFITFSSCYNQNPGDATGWENRKITIYLQ